MASRLSLIKAVNTAIPEYVRQCHLLLKSVNLPLIGVTVISSGGPLLIGATEWQFLTESTPSIRTPRAYSEMDFLSGYFFEKL